jgi:hypothetical protein
MPPDRKVNKAEELTYLYMTIEKDKQIGKLTYGDSCRQIDRQTDRQSGRYSGRQVYRQPGRLADSHRGLWAGSMEDKGTVWYTDRLACWQTGRLTMRFVGRKSRVTCRFTDRQ